MRRLRAVDHHSGLRLLTGEDEGKNPTEERNAKKDVKDYNGRLVWAVSPDGRYGRQEIYV